MGSPAAPNAFGIYVYPNPTTGYLILDEIRLSQGWETLENTSAHGLRVMTQNIKNQNSVTVYLGALRAGIYNAKLRKSDGGTTVFRFVKQ